MSAGTAGVLSRHDTAGGATVEVRNDNDAKCTQATCTGCWHYDVTHWIGSITPDEAEAAARAWAQEHANTCQATRDPDGAS